MISSHLQSNGVKNSSQINDSFTESIEFRHNQEQEMDQQEIEFLSSSVVTH